MLSSLRFAAFRVLLQGQILVHVWVRGGWGRGTEGCRGVGVEQIWGSFVMSVLMVSWLRCSVPQVSPQKLWRGHILTPSDSEHTMTVNEDAFRAVDHFAAPRCSGSALHWNLDPAIAILILIDRDLIFFGV